MAESSMTQEQEEASSTTTSVEIDLQFDENGRTRVLCNTTSSNGQTTIMDYTPKSAMTNLVHDDDDDDTSSNGQSKEPSDRSKLLLVDDDLLFDCEIADCGLLPRTYWMPVDGKQQARCRLEEMALQVFHHHVSSSSSSDESSLYYNAETSGAEWWVQLRPSPPGMGRYAMLASSNNKNNSSNKKDQEKDDDAITESGINFHWDKDEDLRIAAGGNLYVHPHLSTVTYLTNIGAPTLVCHRRVHPLTGKHWLDHNTTTNTGNTNNNTTDDVDDEGYLCWPRLGKHLSFDGRYLHAAPPDFLAKGEWESQIDVVPENTNNTNDRILAQRRRRRRRVTFLVNIWINHKPFNVEPFPEPMIEKLSKHNEDFQLFPSNTSTLPAPTLQIINNNNDDEETNNKNNDKDYATSSLTTTTFTWPMGGGCNNSEETISMKVPLDQVRREFAAGPNFHLLWGKGGLLLSSPSDNNNGSNVLERTNEALTSNDAPESSSQQLREEEDTKKKRQRVN